jgi:secreted PhoX family phosphatase
MTDSAFDRRTFMRRGAMGAGAVWALSLQELSARSGHRRPIVNGVSPYGPISAKPDQSTGLPLIKLPDGFRYWSYSWTGDVMSDGVRCPNLHDGMAVVDYYLSRDGREDDDDDRDRGHSDYGGSNGRDRDCGNDDDDNDRLGRSGKVVLVRNHEGGAGPVYVSNRPDITYAPTGVQTGNGGTTNLVFDTKRGRWLAAWSSLAGTIRNCAGGVTPWGSWLTNEETDVSGHGWNFDVGPERGDITPLVDMGRFSHEAAMVDPKTWYVYQTEDATPSGFYRFIPNRRGRLEQGGRLYMMAVRNRAALDLGGYVPIGTKFDVKWVRIDDPTAATVPTVQQGIAKGGVTFRRLEGAWWGDRTGFFLSTNGGSVGEGQVFEYDPRHETLTVVYDAPNATDVDNPDNITVSPRGGLLLCEDAAGNNFMEGERMVGLTLHGETFTFAMNNINLTQPVRSVPAGDYRQNEWAGACYSPDGKWLFANIQTPGMTFAITGPWGKGPL